MICTLSLFILLQCPDHKHTVACVLLQQTETQTRETIEEGLEVLPTAVALGAETTPYLTHGEQDRDGQLRKLH